MKCSRCGRSFRSIAQLGKHYRREHPRSRSRRSGARSMIGSLAERAAGLFRGELHQGGHHCPICGRRCS